jgi:formylmethanofuran dehydrogenase subunit B
MALPRIVLGHPSLSTAAGTGGSDTVFIPVSTPGIGTAGHLFRTDSSVLMPLFPVYQDTLPSLGDVVGRIERALATVREGVAA